jgi:hypothetical protein
MAWFIVYAYLRIAANFFLDRFHQVVAITIDELHLLQLWQVAKSRESLHFVRGPNNNLEIPSCPGAKADIGDITTRDDQGPEMFEFSFPEGELGSCA